MSKIWIDLKRPINLEPITVGGKRNELKAGRQTIDDSLLSHFLIQALINSGDIVIVGKERAGEVKELDYSKIPPTPPIPKGPIDWEKVIGTEEEAVALLHAAKKGDVSEVKEVVETEKVPELKMKEAKTKSEKVKVEKTSKVKIHRS